MRDLDAVITAAVEATSLRDLGERILPRLRRVARASGTLLYRYDDERRLTPLAGDISELIEHYARHYLHDDPVQTLARRLSPEPRVVLATRRVDRRAHHRSPAYGEFYSAFDLEHLACTWITHLPYGAPGMTGLLFTRPHRAREFDDADQRLLERALPALTAAVARAERLRDLDQQRQALEALAAASAGPPRLVLSSSGRVLWASPACEERLGSALRALPDALRGEARRLVDAALGKGALPAARRLALRIDAEPLAAHLSMLRASSGAPMVLVELETAVGRTRDAGELARRFGLTRAEATVLGQLADGGSNAAIAAALHVSVETVRTHVHRILSKLGVRSRVEAAVLAARHA